MTQPVDAITALKNTTYTPKASANSELSQVDFMKLIIAQMQNQNPWSRSRIRTSWPRWPSSSR
ncbi:flagellar hook capping FlgD N-terminal domain-containing protein [Candidatus Amarobacter glycogenicus]|uniref:flagellar hook capping FlgD N-terminal domain-containing protein n=1 Tax=Candidatus Amarobacter glycogenicus TaxID=3140699 RepID=UPI002A146CA6|nr:hypothetical protein [Dehalococcoidia bacterium]